MFTGLLFYIEVVIHEVWALDNTVYRKGPMALNVVFLFLQVVNVNANFVCCLVMLSFNNSPSIPQADTHTYGHQ